MDDILESGKVDRFAVQCEATIEGRSVAHFQVAFELLTDDRRQSPDGMVFLFTSLSFPPHLDEVDAQTIVLVFPQMTLTDP